jgi:class 3 adenylate cyclase/tetratricopeptide (TPR) repeat protein
VATLVGQALNVYSRFLPGALVEWSTRTAIDSRRPLEAHVGALMITDVSGFTRLTAKLSRDSGQAGAERIGLVLNGFISKLIGTVEQLGGAILSFEGDSLMAGWKSGPESAALASAVWRSCHCALLLQREVGHTLVEDEMLTLRSGIAAGTINLVHLLSHSGNSRVILTGPGTQKVWRCAALAESGETLVSSDTWMYVADHAKGRQMVSGPVQLLDIGTPPQPDGAASPTWSDGPDLASYLPTIVRSRLGSSPSRWLAELRTVTTCFIGITGPELLDDVQKLEQAFDILETKITRFHADLLRISAFEGGLHGLAVFGLPGNAHKDDPRRAILTALELQADVSRLGLNVSIGTATGDAFCGAIGTDRRAEYTVLGESVNRAARLSALAAGRTLADESTAQESSSFISFQGPWSMQVPGIRAPISAFVALRPKRDSALPPHDVLIGRTEELARLKALLDERRRSKTQVTIVVGEPGVGKSTLADTFVKYCGQVDVTVFDGFADDVEHNTPYFAFRRIIRRLLDIELLQGREAYKRIAARLATRPKEISFIPLLTDVLDIGLQGTSTTDELSSSVRSENLRRLLKNLVLDGLLAGPSVLLIEDVHWLDAASAALLAELVQTGKPITVVLTSRTEAVQEHILQRIADIDYLKLKPLDEADTAELVSSSLEHADIPVWLEQAIWQRTGGNPFFVGEICRMIKQRRPETWPRIIPRVETFDEDNSITLPQSARAAVMNRTDTLLSDEQFVLKVASAIGTTFTVADLEAIELISDARINAAECVASLTGGNLFRAVTNDPARFTFSHSIIRDVVYASMLSEQKREAHVAIARAIERGGRLPEAETLPLILHQWQRAGDRRKTFEYLDRVAELRLRQFENISAIAHSEAFLKIAKEEAISAPPGRLAAANFVLGEAQLNLGRMEVARTSFENGLRLLKMPMPRTKLGLAFGMVQQIAEHVVRSKTSDGNRSDVERGKDSAASNDAALKAARTYENLTYIYYFHGDKPRLVYSTLRATNLAELANLSSVLAVNYASLGAICGVIPLRKQAEHYLKLAIQLSGQLGIPTVTAKVNLLAGLYKTSIGEWLSAKSFFELGLKQASTLGDTTRWSQLAVSLETIISPWLLNPSFGGKQAWSELVDKICQTARANGDPQVLGSGLIGAIRGYRILGADASAHAYLDQLSSFMREEPAVLEPIHRLEGAAFLADAALDRGDLSTWQHWLEQAALSIKAVNPRMKSRTLSALSAAFSTAMRQPEHAEPADVRDIRCRIAKACAANLDRFARIYPIGRPRAALFQGDILANLGRTARAAKLWRQALANALHLDMPADALASLVRLRAAGFSMTETELRATQNLDASLLARDSEFRKTAQLAAAALTIGGGHGLA